VEAEAAMKKFKASRFHHAAEIAELAANRIDIGVCPSPHPSPR
jgi:hypothetical protein